jgi:hypothetical protein
MTLKNRGIRHIAELIILATSLGTMSCSSIDVSTDEGIKEALTKRERLDKAIPKISGMQTKPEQLKEFVPELVDLYMSENNAFDREIISALAVTGDERANQAFMRGAKSDDYKQVMDAARGVKLTGAPDVMSHLLSIYDQQINPEVKRVILEIGTANKGQEWSAKAKSILNGNLDDTSISLLRISCDVLAFQQDTSKDTVETLMRVIYYQDGQGHSLTANCTRALMATPNIEEVEKALLNAYKLENKDLMDYVAKHPDTLTPESIRNNTAVSLGQFRYADAVEPMLDYIADTHTIPVPGTLAIRPADDPAWPMWASLVGVASQATIFALNDIGVRDNQKAKQVFMNLFKWPKEYKAKFKNAIELTGSSNIEVSMRVNAFRLLRENELISDEEIKTMIESLKGEEFQDEKKWRPFARASIATDMITYLAVTSRKGDLDQFWKVFNDMKAKDHEFYVPEPENPDAPKVQHYNDSISQRIDDVKSTFEMAEVDSANAETYAGYLTSGKFNGAALTGYQYAKIMYELGYSNEHKYFDVICDNYKKLDVFSQMYGTKALAQLGNSSDIPKVEALIKKLANEMSQIQYISAKPNLEGLINTLRTKK